MDQWLTIYRTYSPEELSEEIAWLRVQSRNLFVAQTEGNRSHSRTTREIPDRLEAALQVQKERAGTMPSNALQIDFTNILR